LPIGVCRGNALQRYDVFWKGNDTVPLFAVTLTFTNDLERRLEVRPKHREYLETLLKDGKLHESGPFGDDSGALLIYDVKDVAEVQELLSADPYTPTGIIAGATIKEWNVVMSRQTKD
jgi:uncharacterized protein YciI